MREKLNLTPYLPIDSKEKIDELCTFFYKENYMVSENFLGVLLINTRKVKLQLYLKSSIESVNARILEKRKSSRCKVIQLPRPKQVQKVEKNEKKKAPMGNKHREPETYEEALEMEREYLLKKHGNVWSSSIWTRQTKLNTKPIYINSK